MIRENLEITESQFKKRKEQKNQKRKSGRYDKNICLQMFYFINYTQIYLKKILAIALNENELICFLKEKLKQNYDHHRNRLCPKKKICHKLR